MKKLFLGLGVGIAIGGAATWLALRHDAPESEAHGAAKAEEKHEAAPTPRSLTKEQLAAARLVVGSPRRATVAPELDAFGRVLDPAPLLAAVAEIATAQAALAASEKELARVRRLHAEGENASAQAVEAAEAAAQRDRVQFLAARTRLAGSWGPVLAAKADLKFVSEALEKSWALVRIDAPAGDAPTANPTSARVGALTGEATTPVELLGPAPLADPQLQGGGYLGLWREGALPPGTALRATLGFPGNATAALVLPRSAVVRHDGSTWTYVETKAGSFTRRRVELGRAQPEGYAVADGVAENDRVVIEGAQQLLSTELQAAGGGEP